MSEGAQDLGAVVTAGLAAREVERGRGGHAGAHGHDAACANCGTALVGAFCHACGQHGHVHRTAGAILHDIGHGVFHFEGKVFRTLPKLAFRPGELTRRYIDGERARFVSPMALFLFSVFLMFASLTLVAPKMNTGGFGRGTETVARQVAAQHDALVARVRNEEGDLNLAASRGEDAEDIAERRQELASLRKEERDLAAARAAIGAGQKGMSGNANTGWPWLDGMIGHVSDNPELSLYKFKTAAYKYSWALIPISLPFIWLLFPFSRRFGFYDHAIFATYSLAFMTLMVVAGSILVYAGVQSGIVVFAAMLIAPIHMYKQLKGTYLQRRWPAVIRTLLLLFFTVFTTAFFGLLLGYLGLA